MKLVQVGILVALLVVGVLLFQVYRGQQQQQSTARLIEPTAALPPADPTPAVADHEKATPTEPIPAKTPARQAEPRPSAGRAKATPPAPAPPVTSTPAAAAVEPRPVAVRPADPAPGPAPVSTPEPTPGVAAAPPAVTPPPPPPAPRTVTLAAGTLISARLSDTLASDKVKAGDAFTATLDKPLVVDGYVIAERGARASGKVVEAVEAGRVRGLASLSIQLVQIETSDGQRAAIQTDPFRKEGEETRRQDAAKVGGGAGLGAIIGAIAGGGKGAAIGAAVGGAAGAGTVAATRGKPAVLPVETRIDFRLSQPVTLTENR